MKVQYEVTDGVALITINRPERMNAMDQETYDALSDAWIKVRDDSDVRSAVITGAGDKSFTAGADLKAHVSQFMDESEFWKTQQSQLLNRGLEIWKPVVAAINGYCLGGGMTLMLATDIRIASENAEFGVPEVPRGLLPGNGGTQRILEQLPHPIGMEMLLLGERIDSAKALRWGLVNEVVPQGELMKRAMERARQLAALPPLAAQAAKEMALRARDMDRNTGLRIEMTMLRMLQKSEDAKNAKATFAARSQG